MQNVNRVVLTGNLTRDPEIRRSSGGVAICNLRIASNSRIKRSNEWVDKVNYFDVVVFGPQGENCHRYLTKGRPVCVDGRLDWREWEQDGNKRQAVQILGENVQFLSDGSDRSTERPAQSAPPISRDDDDDIPF